MPLHVLDTERLRDARPNHTVFNGVHDGMIKKPLAAKPGERVRLFVLNVGPSKTSSFHVVGTIFDRVWFEGNPDNQFRGMQTVLLGSSNSAIVEFVIPEKGSYIMVDHHFANASQGAIGLIEAGAKAEEADTEHHNLPASAARPTRKRSRRRRLRIEVRRVSRDLRRRRQEDRADLLGVTQRRSEDWITGFLKSPEQMLASDPAAKALLDKYKVPMPNQNLSDQEIRGYIKYFRFLDSAQKEPAQAATKK